MEKEKNDKETYRYNRRISNKNAKKANILRNFHNHFFHQSFLDIEAIRNAKHVVYSFSEHFVISKTFLLHHFISKLAYYIELYILEVN